MPRIAKEETAEQREMRLARQRAYEARRRAADPEGFRRAQAESARRYAERHPEKRKEAVRKWRDTNIDRVYAARRRYRVNNIVRMLFVEARARAKKRGVEFSIEFEDIPAMGEACPLLGHPFNLDGGRSPFSPSLDRIDPTKGYVKGNVWIVGYRANLIKNDGTAEEHEKIALAMRAVKGP